MADEQQANLWTKFISEFEHGWWGWVLSALAAYFATLAPDLIRSLCLLAAVAIAAAKFHGTKFADRRWLVTVPASVLFAILAVVLFLGARYFDRHSLQAKAEGGSVSGPAPQQATGQSTPTEVPQKVNSTQANSRHKKAATQRGQSAKASSPTSKPTEEEALRETTPKQAVSGGRLEDGNIYENLPNKLEVKDPGTTFTNNTVRNMDASVSNGARADNNLLEGRGLPNSGQGEPQAQSGGKGADMAAIRAAQTRNQYPGGFPDAATTINAPTCPNGICPTAPNACPGR
jgi:hypothetical protein